VEDLTTDSIRKDEIESKDEAKDLLNKMTNSPQKLGSAIGKSEILNRTLQDKQTDSDGEEREFAQEFARFPKRDRSTYQFYVHSEVIDFKTHAAIVSQEGTEINIITCVDGRN
jgi:hypothetical protein